MSYLDPTCDFCPGPVPSSWHGTLSTGRVFRRMVLNRWTCGDHAGWGYDELIDALHDLAKTQPRVTVRLRVYETSPARRSA